MGEAVADETKLALLGVLLDRVEELFLGDLCVWVRKSASCTIDVAGGYAIGWWWKAREWSYLLLGVGPAGDLNDHVQDGLLLVGVEGNVVEGRDGDAILLDVNTVLQRVRLGNLANGVGHVGCGGREMPGEEGSSGERRGRRRSGGRKGGGRGRGC